jgi:hypothetical protein
LKGDDYTKNPLWPILVETVHALVMYPKHKSYVRDVLLRDKPDLDAREIQLRLGITFGEALVIYFELKSENTQK